MKRGTLVVELDGGSMRERYALDVSVAADGAEPPAEVRVMAVDLAGPIALRGVQARLGK
jgi:hypothetical protein